MTCAQCGTAIADKALICYKCGAGTTTPRHQAAQVVPPNRWVGPVVWLAIAAVVLVVIWRAGLLGGL